MAHYKAIALCDNRQWFSKVCPSWSCNCHLQQLGILTLQCKYEDQVTVWYILWPPVEMLKQVSVSFYFILFTVRNFVSISLYFCFMMSLQLLTQETTSLQKGQCALYTFFDCHQRSQMVFLVCFSLYFITVPFAQNQSQLTYQIQYTLNYYIWLSPVQAFIKTQPRIFSTQQCSN